jgi:phenylacetate-CoA ligase
MSDCTLPDRAAIEAGQLGALRAMIAELIPDNRFYTRKLSTAGATEMSSLDEFFTRIPFTFKQEVVDDQRAHPPYGSNLTYPLARYTRFSQTSGTTGTPLRWLDTPESWNWMLEKWLMVYRVCAVGPGDSLFFASGQLSKRRDDWAAGASRAEA